MHGPYHLLTYQCMLYNCFNLLKMLYKAVRMCACCALLLSCVFLVKRPFIYSLLWVTKFSMLSTCAEFSAHQNGGFPQANSINLGDVCLFVSLCKSAILYCGP